MIKIKTLQEQCEEIIEKDGCFKIPCNECLCNGHEKPPEWDCNYPVISAKDYLEKHGK